MNEMNHFLPPDGNFTHEGGVITMSAASPDDINELEQFIHSPLYPESNLSAEAINRLYIRGIYVWLEGDHPNFNPTK